MSEHLTEAVYLALVEGRLEEEERARVARHLEEECEVCETFLLAHEADHVDGIVDDALVSLAPSQAVSDDLGFRRVERAMRSERSGRLGLAAGLIAAALAAVFLFPAEREQRFKGEDRATGPRLELLVSRDGEILPLGREARVRIGDMILFRVLLEEEECVQMFREDVALLDAPVCLAAGEHVLEAGGTPLGWAAKQAGRAEFVVVPAGSPPPPEDVARFPIIVEDR